MKIMWLCNTPTKNVAKAFHLPQPAQGGWLRSVSEALEENQNIQFVFIIPNVKGQQGRIYKECGNSLYIATNVSALTDEEMIHAFAEIIEEVKPDIIHIWGTEYKHSYAMAMGAKKQMMLNRVVVSIQGMVGMIAQHYMGGIPAKYQLVPSFRDILRKDTLKIQQRSLEYRGAYEKKIVEVVQHVIGRTFWDEACVKLINPNVKYHFNNETLREEFYSSQWNYEECEKHSIFVSQSHYPIKGFHYLLKAVALIKDRYQDIKIYISGYDNALKPGVLVTAYGKYIQYLIKKYKLSSNIHYVGMLNAEEMKKQFLKSEVFVSPSVIENSPNSVGEAMLLGMPVIAANVGGVATMLRHEKEGYLYQADAPYLLAYYICQFFEDRQKEKEFGQNARIHAQRTHDKDKNIKELIEIYEKIVAER